MLNFRKVELRDKPQVEKYLRKSDFRGCEYTFGNIFLWGSHYNTEICFSEGFCFEKQGRAKILCLSILTVKGVLKQR